MISLLQRYPRALHAPATWGACLLMAACTGLSPQTPTQTPGQAPQTAGAPPAALPPGLDLRLWGHASQGIQNNPPGQDRPFNLRIEDMPASHVLDLMAKELNWGYSFDQCGEKRVSLMGREMPMSLVLASLEEQTGATLTTRGKHVDLRCERDELQVYAVDYLALNREMLDRSSLTASVANQNREVGQRRDAGNVSELLLTSQQDHRLWDRLTVQIEQLIQAQVKPEEIATRERVVDEDSDRNFESSRDSGRTRFSTPRQTSTVNSSNRRDITTTRRETRSGRVVANPESGTVAVLTTPAGHRRVQHWLTQVQRRLDRQILIEATITEITLNSRYARGVDWNVFTNKGTELGLMVQGLALTNPVLNLTLNRTTGQSETSVALRLLEEFGNTSVLSAPRVVVMNQQAAVLKVVDNRVYFTTDVQTSAPTSTSPAFSVFNTQVQTVPVGFLMTVTPQVSDHQQVQLRVRPTLSRILGFVQDPNPALRQFNIISQVPEIQTRELESVLKIQSGQTTLLGGLHQREGGNLLRGLPGLTDENKPLSSSHRQQTDQTELVILLKATVIEPELGPGPNARLDNSSEHTQLAQGLQHAHRLASQQQLGSAIGLLNRLTKTHPTHPEVRFNLALLYAMDQQRATAKATLEEVFKLCPIQRCELPLHTLSTLLEYTP